MDNSQLEIVEGLSLGNRAGDGDQLVRSSVPDQARLRTAARGQAERGRLRHTCPDA
jgi:hypothetical protein